MLKSLENQKKKTIILLSSIIGSSLILRMYFFPFGIPLTLDALGYFWYANDIVTLAKIPSGHTFANNGWPLFLAPIFSLIHQNDMIYQMEIQRIVSVIVSTATTIPVYFLCKRFVEKKIAIFGALLFAFEPRLIQNSLLGLNDSLFILLGTIALVLFLSQSNKAKILSFVFIGFASIIRAEGLFLFFALSIMYFVFHRKNQKEILRYGIAFLIFLSIIIPIALVRQDTTGNDALTGRIVSSVSDVTTNSEKLGIDVIIKNTIITFTEFLGWDLIPLFIFFVPVGIILAFKNRNFENKTIIVTMVLMMLPALYAYSIPARDTKYFYFLYPIFCVLSCFAINKYGTKILNPKTIMAISVTVILIGSLVFLSVKIPDKEEQMEYFQVSKYIVDNTMVINEFYPESNFIVPATFEKEWPTTFSDFRPRINVVDPTKYNTLEELILENKNLTHVVVDDKESRSEFLREVFSNEEKYPYLTKIFDSNSHGYKIHIKIFEIDSSKLKDILG